MKQFLWVVVVAVVGVAVAFAATQFFGKPTTEGGIDFARQKSSANGIYVVQIQPEKEPLQQGPMHAWLLTLKTADGKPVDGAEIGVDGGMPAHGHGLPTAPAVSAYLGEGRYRIDGFVFNMAGAWELKFAIRAAPGNDDVVFNVNL